MSLVTYKARNLAALEYGCSSTVAGTKWINCYTDFFSDTEKMMIIQSQSCKVFKFGG